MSLRDLEGSDLTSILAEEARDWSETLYWDFTPSAELVVRFVNLRSLDGHALVVGNQVAGYVYYIIDEHKGLIGDLYVSRRFRSWEREDVLLGAVIQTLLERVKVQRIESQLMMLSAPLERRLPYSQRIQAFSRTFMMRAIGHGKLGRGPGADRILLESWRDERCEDASAVIAASYRGHVDARINDQYETTAGARRFLDNIIQFPGCGHFFRQGSFLAFDQAKGTPVGLVMTSLVAKDVGHVTQVCVVPEARGWGIGYELVRQAIEALEEAGCQRVSLTVTTSNRSAVALYGRMGFQTLRTFGAHVWS